MDKIFQVTDSSWDNDVLNHQGLVMVDFWAEWCGPCKMIAPVIEELSNEVSGVKVCKLNVDENPETAFKYQVTGIPTLLFFKDGKPIEQVVGFTGKDSLKTVINRHL